MNQYISRYITWAPVVGRILLGLIFLQSALYKIPGTEFFGFQVETSAAAGIPLASVAVALAFLLEVIAGAALVIGWYTRRAAVLLIAFVILIIAFFVRDITDQVQLMILMGSLQLIAGLLYISAFGPGRFSVDNRQQVAAVS